MKMEFGDTLELVSRLLRGLAFGDRRQFVPGIHVEQLTLFERICKLIRRRANTGQDVIHSQNLEALLEIMILLQIFLHRLLPSLVGVFKFQLPTPGIFVEVKVTIVRLN